MLKDLTHELVIKCRNKEIQKKTGNYIHNLLCGHPDYIMDNIVLHLDEDSNNVEIYFNSEDEIELLETGL